MLRTLAATKTGGSAAARKVNLVSTSFAPRSVHRQHEQTQRELPLHHRINEAAFPTSGRETESQRSASNAAFRHAGDYWQILYEGRRISLRSAKGLLYLRHLLQHPGETIHVSSLTALGDHYASVLRAARPGPDSGLDVPPQAPLIANDSGGVIDHRATWEYKARLDELRAELEEASQWADFGRVSSIQRQIDFIQKELASAYGLRGHLRKLDDQIERMRKAVTNRIHDSIVRIAKQNPILGRHLTNAIRTGLFCRYSPETKVPWEF